jgi:hypothetical protein
LVERGILIDGQPSTPGTLNAWLRKNGGYVPGTDDFEESAAEKISPVHIRWTNSSMHRTNDLEWSEVVALVDSHAAVIINVMHGGHFVLVVGYDQKLGGDTLFVNDPGFNRPSCVSPPLSRRACRSSLNDFEATLTHGIVVMVVTRGRRTLSATGCLTLHPS